MGLLDGFERLINEHGSATILKERIELANDKYSALEQKNSIFEQKITVLESENKTLRLNLEKAEDEVQNLKKLTEKSHSGRLDKVKEKILLALAEQKELEARHISSLLNIGSQLATFHLEELKASDMVSDYYAVGSPVCWGIIQGGRTYLVCHGLLA